jgi:hypothetical protein
VNQLVQSRNLTRPIALASSIFLGLICLPSLHAQSTDLPPGPMQTKVRTACLECHESRIIVQQRLNKRAWTKEVDKMVKWGALVDPTDRDAFIDYLSAHFPPEKPPEPMPRVAGNRRPAVGKSRSGSR